MKQENKFLVVVLIAVLAINIISLASIRSIIPDAPEPTATPEHYKAHNGEVVCEEACWHEVAHKYWFENLSESDQANFKQGILEFLRRYSRELKYDEIHEPYGASGWSGGNHVTTQIQIHPLMHLIVTFPGFFHECLSEHEDYCWGGWTELYAEIFEFYQGQSVQMPAGYIRGYYGFRETLEYYHEYRPEHFTAKFCADWAFGQENEQDSYAFCMTMEYQE